MVPLLRRAGHTVVGSTRSIEIGRELERAGVVPAVLDVFDAQALMESVCAARPEVIVHQLTDLPRQFDAAKVAASSERNARIRIEGTRNLLAAAQAAAVRRFIVQSIAFAYVPGGEPHPETDPLNLADPARGRRRPRASRHCMSTPPRRRRCSRSRAVLPAFTTLPMTTGPCRSPRHVPSSASTRASEFIGGGRGTGNQHPLAGFCALSHYLATALVYLIASRRAGGLHILLTAGRGAQATYMAHFLRLPFLPLGAQSQLVPRSTS